MNKENLPLYFYSNRYLAIEREAHQLGYQIMESDQLRH